MLMKNNPLLYKIFALILTLAILAGITACQSAGVTSDSSEGSQHPSKGEFADIANGNNPPQAQPPTERDIAVRRINITLDDYEVELGASFIPNVIILPANATDQTYTLESDDDSVLRLMGDRFTAVGSGTADIVATSSNGVVGWTTVSVVVPVRSITFTEGHININLGDNMTLSPVIYPEDASGRGAQYSSSDERVATVNQNGVIRGVAEGTAEIDCTIDSVSAGVTVTVGVPVTGITVNANKRTYTVGSQGTYTVTFTPNNASDKSYTSSVSGAGELLGNNTFSCTAAGEIVITVTTANGVSSSQSVSVIDITSFANEVFNLTNVERANAGLPLFARRNALTRAAEVRANESIRSFSHTRPDGRSCFSAFDENGVTYRYAGENLAMGQRTPDEVVRGWMESPGHRENILNVNYGHLGIGIVMDSNGVLYWTQAFTA